MTGPTFGTSGPVVHSGPVYVDPGLVLMCRIERLGPSYPYKVQIWDVEKKEGLDTETDELVKAMWTLTASLLEAAGKNLEAAIPNVKAAIMTLVQEMDLKTKDTQFAMAAISNPSIRIIPPGEK